MKRWKLACSTVALLCLIIALMTITAYAAVEPGTGHTVTYQAAIEATCCTNGSLEYWYCPECDVYYEDEACTIPTDYRSLIIYPGYELTYVEGYEATCHSTGLEEHEYCEECGQCYSMDGTPIDSVSVIIPAYGSDNVEHVEACPPSCDRPGMKEHWYCPDCDSYFADEDLTVLTNRKNLTIPAVDHSWTGATCTDPKRCTECGTISGTALGHSLDTQRTEATCQQEGLVVETCARCGYQRSTVLPITDHRWVDASCTEARHCVYCDLTTGSALGHHMEDADCEHPRHCTYCTYCEGASLGHDYLVTTGICSRCGGSTPFNVEAPQLEYSYGSTTEKVRSQWTKVEGVDGYELYQSNDPEDLRSFELVKTIKDPDTLTYTKGGLTPGVTYYYRVCAYVLLEDGITRVRSPLSNVRYCMPTVLWNDPYSNSDSRIRLRWEAVEGAAGFQIWRKGEGEGYRVVKTVKDGEATAYSNVHLQSGGIYTYKIRAYYINDDGSRNYGTYSAEVTVAVQPSKPQITVTSPKAGKALVTWEDLYGASAYQVWMSESPDSGFKIIKSIYDGDVTSYTKSGLTSGKTYYFKVRASIEVDGKKSFGAYSEVISITIE